VEEGGNGIHGEANDVVAVDDIGNYYDSAAVKVMAVSAAAAAAVVVGKERQLYRQWYPLPFLPLLPPLA